MVFLTSQCSNGLRSTSVRAVLGLASAERAHIHGRRSNGEDEMERINADRRTADSGSFASGDLVVGRGRDVAVVVDDGGVVSLMIRDCLRDEGKVDCRIEAEVVDSGAEDNPIADAFAFWVVLTCLVLCTRDEIIKRGDEAGLVVLKAQRARVRFIVSSLSVRDIAVSNDVKM